MKPIYNAKSSLTALSAVAVGLILTGGLYAQTAVTLPDTSQTTEATATVSEQAKVQVPAGVTFTVTDISSSTAAPAASVTVTNIVLATATKQLIVSIQAGAAAFSPSVAEAVTWSASDVSWNAATWTGATGATGTLSEAAYNEVATCAADAAGCNTAGLIFTLAPKTTVQRSGNHTLNLTWKFDSVGA